jgi:phage tail tape-measure protein
VAGNTPEDLQAAADDGEPGALDTIFKVGNDIPVVDVLTTLVGTGVGTYYDVKGGQPLGSALRDEAISNTAGTVAATGAGYLVGAEWGAQLGAAAGPVGLVAGAVIGYGAGDIAHNLLVENWDQDVHDHGVVHGIMDGVGHSMDASADDTRELAVGGGHEAEHLWDSVF